MASLSGWPEANGRLNQVHFSDFWPLCSPLALAHSFFSCPPTRSPSALVGPMTTARSQRWDCMGRILRTQAPMTWGALQAPEAPVSSSPAPRGWWKWPSHRICREPWPSIARNMQVSLRLCTGSQTRASSLLEVMLKMPVVVATSRWILVGRNSRTGYTGNLRTLCETRSKKNQMLKLPQPLPSFGICSVVPRVVSGYGGIASACNCN